MSLPEVKRLNQIIKNNSDIYNEKRFNMDFDLTELLKLVLVLHEKEYKFSEHQLNKIVSKVVAYEVYACFLTEPKSAIQKNCIDVLFTHIITTQEHVTQLLNNLNHSRAKNYYIIDLLFKINYTFTFRNLELIIELDYNIHNYRPIIFEQSTLSNFILQLLMPRNKVDPYRCIFEDLINKTESIPETYIVTLFEYLDNELFDCKEFNVAFVISIIYTLLKKINNYDKDTLLNIIVKNNIYNIELNQFIIQNIGYNDKYLDFIFSSCNISLLFELIIIGFVPTVDTLNKILHANYDIPGNNKMEIDAIKKYCDIIGGDFKVYFYGEINKTNVEVLPKGPKKKASKGKPTTIYAIEIYDLFSLLKIEPTFDTISKLIKLKKHDIINEILSKNLIISDKKLLDITIKTFDIKLIDMILKYKITPDIETLNIIISKHLSDKYTKSKKILEILELLIHYGLQINFDNIKDLLSASLYVNNLERFNILYDEDLYFVCYINSYFPEEYMKKFTIDKNVLTMRHYQWKKNNTTDNFIEFVTKNNLKIDRYTIGRLFLNNNVNCIDLMIKYKFIPDLITTLNSQVNYIKFPMNKKSAMCKYIVETNHITKEYMMEVFEI